MTFLIGSALPVTWVSFNGNWRNTPAHSVVLKWETAWEEQNEKYEVQRSTDGIHFQTIGSVPGSRTSATPHTYSYADELNDMAGIDQAPELFYRIKQMDPDGHFSYSVIISLGNPSVMKVRVYPNPSDGLLRLTLARKPSFPCRLMIFDSKGMLVLQQDISGTETGIDLRGKAKGIYWFQLRFANGAGQAIRMELN
jgi:hypothetical protein